ncbi:MAG: glycosyltransferase [Leptospiraceae bacterium]|nr:glycosyltransferase [Leptospiraceae bacterium]
MILHINTAKTWRGGEQQLLYLAEGLHKRNIPQVVVGLPDSELQSRVGDIPFEPVNIKGEWDIFSAFKIIKLINKYNIKLIHTHTARAHTIGLFIKIFKPKLILVVSRRVDFSIKKNLGSKLKYYSPKNNIFLAVSGKIREILVEDGVDPEKVITVYSGINLKKFDAKVNIAKLKKEFNLSRNTIIVGNIAALVDHKDQKTLLKAFSLIPSLKNIKLFILGEGELEEELKALARDLHLGDRVIFTGFRKDVPEFLKLFDIFTLTSKEEGLGTTILDAMCNSLPIVATSAGGIGEMIDHEEGGYLAEPKDSVRIAEYIEKLASEKSLRTKFGKYNLKNVEKFSVENTILKTIDVYSNFLGNKFWEQEKPQE